MSESAASKTSASLTLVVYVSSQTGKTQYQSPETTEQYVFPWRAVLDGFELLYSSDWTTLLRRTSDVIVRGLHIVSPREWPNGDGIDIESGSNITLEGLNVSTGDDCIAMRSGNCNTLRTPWPAPIAPLHGVRVLNCTLRSSSSAVKVENLFQVRAGQQGREGGFIFDLSPGIIWLHFLVL